MRYDKGLIMFKFATVVSFTLLFATVPINEIKAQAVPFAVTQPARLVTSANATLNGMAVPNGLPTSAWYEWGAQGSFGQQTSPIELGSGNGVVRVSQPITGLTNQGAYQFRLVASNAVGTTYGAIQLFATGLRMTTWDSTGTFADQQNAPTNVVAVSTGEAITSALTTQNGLVMSSSFGADFTSPFTPAATNAVAISAGGSLTLAVHTDDTLIAWGGVTASGYGPGSVPAGLTNVDLVYAGPRYALALRNDGTVVAWGQWTSLFPFTDVTVPDGLTNVVALSGGLGHCVALLADGTVQAWGNNYYGQLDVPGGLSNVVAIAAGYYFSVALIADGTVVKWPGSGLSVPPYAPALTIASNAVAIAAAYNGTLVLTTNGAVLGFGSLTNVPLGLSNVVGIASGYGEGNSVGRNLPPSGTSQSVTGFPNSQLIITLTGKDPNSDPLVFKINSLPAVGTLYQYDAGSPKVSITETNTVVTDSGGRVIYVPITNQFGSLYAAFTFLANDGQVDSPPANIVVNIAIPAVPVLSSKQSLWAPKSGFSLTFSGTSNATYRVWSSTNLADWTLLGTASNANNGAFHFLDSAASNVPFRFYRAGAP